MEKGRAHRRISAVSFTLKNLKDDLEDVGSKFDGRLTWSSAWRPTLSSWSNPVWATSESRPVIASLTATRTRRKRRCT